MSYLHSINLTYPDNYYSQDRLFEELSTQWKEHFYNPERLKRFHKNVLVKGRHLALTLSEYTKLKGHEDKNAMFQNIALKLIEKSVSELIESSGIDVTTIDAIFSNTVTGLSVPSLEALLMHKIPFSAHTKRIPLFGLGCMAGVSGINRASEYLKVYPSKAVLFFSVELCSLTVQFDDFSIENLISTALFGDGMASVLLVGEDHPLKKNAPLQWIGSNQLLIPNSKDVMGWEFRNSGQKVILDSHVPKITEKYLSSFIETSLQNLKLSTADITHFMSHPGGPKVLEAVEKAMGFNSDELHYSWNCLKEKGNMSSVSVLKIINDHLNNPGENKDHAVSFAMGPGFSMEAGVFKWI